MQFRFKVVDGVTLFTDWYEETYSNGTSNCVAYIGLVREEHPDSAISVERRLGNGTLPPTNNTIHLGGHIYLDGYSIIGTLSNATLLLDGGLLS